MKNTIAKAVMSAMLPVLALQFAHAAVPSSITQSVPGKMNYQGYLQDVAGGYAYQDGVYTLDCRIYNSETGGTCLWGGRYRAYVKNGYFNIMLGDENSTQGLDDMSNVTYTNAGDLWKALWGANDTDTTRYLGVTVHQDASGYDVENPTEIMPRQQLLTSPFAFRAQSAKYASESMGDFTVGGNLTVNGTTTFSGTINAQSGTQQIGPIRANATNINLGNGYTAATADTKASIPTYLYGVANYLYFYSYYSMNFKPTAGHINFTVPSGYDMKVTGAGDFISDVPVNTIGGSGATTISGSSTTIKSASGSQVIANANGILGKGALTWMNTRMGSYQTPFQVKKMTFTINASTTGANEATIAENNDYVWMVVGTEVSNNSVTPLMARAFPNNGHTKWTLRYGLKNGTSSAVTMTVTVLGINSSMCNYTSN